MENVSVRLLRVSEVQRIVGLSRSCIYQLISEGRFPKQRKISSRAVAWKDHDIAAWINSKTDA
jgi:prophage regulatory protein